MSDSMGSFDSLDGFDTTTAPGDEPLPSDLEPLHQRVRQDSALWRAGLPGTDTLARQVTSLAQRKPESRLSSYRIREELHMQDPNPGEIPSMRPAAVAHPTHSRARGFLAGGAALVLVALFVAFFAVLPHGGQKPNTAGSVSATATSTTATASQHGKWQPVASLTHTPSVPFIAPNNPSVVYDIVNGVVRRSADGGATWTNLTNPSDFPSGDTPQWLDLFISPLSPDTLWTTANLTNPSGGAINCPVPYPTASTGSNIAAGTGSGNLLSENIQNGGSVPCQVQNVSRDGGKTWKLVKLSFAYMLGTVIGDTAAINNVYDQFSRPPQLQSDQFHTRMYTLTTLGPLAFGATGGHVAVSSDGGVTWQDASKQLSNAGLDVCDMATVPAVSTIFAVANGNGCGLDGATAPSLWRSDNAGASWQQVTLPPNRFIFGLAAAGAPQPVLYAQTATLTHSHAANTASLPADYFASADGGKTWIQAPSAGVPANVSGSSSMTILSGENVVVPFISVDPQAGPTAPATYTFDAWQPGAKAWKKLTQLSLYGIAQFQTLPDPGTGAEALWLTIPDTGDPQGNTPFSVETYLP